jgi:hypothetical protein
MDELHDLYTSGVLGKKDFESEIYKSIFDGLLRCKIRNIRQDEWSDFVSWMYPRISTAIDSYRNRGASFETYLTGLIRWGIKEYRSRLADRHTAEYTAWASRLSEMKDVFAADTEPEYMGQEEAETGAAETARAKNPRQLLILILKCYYYVSDDFLDRAAPRAGVSKDELKGMIEKMRKLRAERDDAIHDMRERLYCQYYRCIIYERKLVLLPENSMAAYKMRGRLEKAKQRLAAMRSRYARMQPNATNSQIAEVLGITKGSVDASLYSLKTRWQQQFRPPEGGPPCSN